MKIKMYHKTSCSTSRKALDIMKDAGIDPEIVLYVKEVPSKRSLRSVAKKLGGVKNMIRTKEALYKEEFKDKEFSDEEWIGILHEHPNLIKRPIIIKGRKAVIARPMEDMIEMLGIKVK